MSKFTQTIKHNPHLRQQYVAELVTENPKLSLSDLARICANTGVAMRLEELRPLRARALADKAREDARKTPVPVIPTKTREATPAEAAEVDAVLAKLAQPPSEPVTPPEPEKAAEPSEPVTSPEPKKEMTHRERLKAESAPRRAWAEAWALDHPTATSRELRAALVAQFGLGIDTAVINAILKTVRDIAAPAPAEPPPVVSAVAPPATPPPPREDMVAAATKRGWLRTWLDTHPDAGRRECTEALQQRFGSALQGVVISALVEEARKRAPKPPKAPKELGELFLVTYKGRFWELRSKNSVTEKIGCLTADGAAVKDITVWRPVTFKTKTVTTVSFEGEE